ncbi:hypothetical protein ACH4SK_12875 [Streptomyces inhibens]|uniref:hypothetical protein n=1 Tax=Streptomyces inhibens TaxID=2293571 RepID=UPI0037B7AA12
MGELADAYAIPALGSFDLDFHEGGTRVRSPLGVSWNTCFEQAAPVRPFRWTRGGERFAGWHWAATTGGQVGYESWLERDWLILLDADPHVTGIASQPGHQSRVGRRMERP